MSAGLGLAFLAGLLSTLSPCVLPLLPLVLGAAASAHRHGPVALAGGLVVSFVAIGLFVATTGFGLGLDGDVFRRVAAGLLVLVGLILVVPAAHTRLAVALGPIADRIERRFGGFVPTGPRGQFGVGLLLGAVWSPCVGPTLGAASLLAAQGRDLPAVASTMLLFGLGAALPLLILGTVPRLARAPLMRVGKGLKLAFGVILIATGLAVLAGTDKRVEAVLVEASPAWLTQLTTRY